MIRDQPWITWIKWLPIELRLTIYDFIDIETRLEILAPLITDTIRYLYRANKTTTLLHKYEQLIYMRLFTKVNDGYSTKPEFKQLLPPTMYLKGGVRCMHTHPLIRLLKQDLKFSSFSKRMILSVEQNHHRTHMYHYEIVRKIQQCFNLMPTIVSFNAEFDYQIKRIIIRFLHHLTKITDVIKEEDRQRELLANERKLRRYYSKRIVTRIRIQSNKMQQRITKNAKIAEKNAKIAEKNAKIAEKNATRQYSKIKKLITQNAKNAAKKAKQNAKLKKTIII